MVTEEDTVDRSILIFFSDTRGKDREWWMRGQDENLRWDVPLSQHTVVLHVTRAPWQVTSACWDALWFYDGLTARFDTQIVLDPFDWYCLMMCITLIWEADVKESRFLTPGWFVLPEFRSVWISVAWNTSELTKAILKFLKDTKIILYKHCVTPI